MLFSKFLVASAAATAASAWSIPTLALRELYSGKDIVEDIKAIDSAIKNLTISINEFTSSSYKSAFVGGIPVIEGVGAVHIADQKGVAHGNFATSFTTEDSVAIVDAYSWSVAITGPIAVTSIKNKKSEFQKVFATPAVLSSLQLLQTDNDALGQSIFGRAQLTATKKAEGQAAFKKVHDAIADGIAFYSTPF